MPRVRKSQHPLLDGNFAPTSEVRSPVSCRYKGLIPHELLGGQYVRNGSNPAIVPSGRSGYHWFDGDGMLTGVYFRRTYDSLKVQPEFVCKYVCTDIYRASEKLPARLMPILPSFTTLINQSVSIFTLAFELLRTLFLIAWSYIQLSQSPIKRISVANTNIIFHDGRALALNETGPPMRIKLPEIETVDWFTGRESDGVNAGSKYGFGGPGLLGFFKEWTTAHPHIDPLTQELVLLHSTLIPPYVRYSIIPNTNPNRATPAAWSPILGATVLGFSSPRIIHDFGVSLGHIITLDSPLSFNLINILRGRPIVHYKWDGVSRFGIFPRRTPNETKWFETGPCLIFHVANSWDERQGRDEDFVVVNMLVCRMTSASIMYLTGDVPSPTGRKTRSEEEQCRLYYYQFNLSDQCNNITHEWALSAIWFELPVVPKSKSMRNARFVYGYSTAQASFGDLTLQALKADCLVKVNAGALIEKGKKESPVRVMGCVDKRSISEIITSADPNDPIKVFRMPPGCYGAECSFVSREGALDEDDGWLLTFVFDESQLQKVSREQFSELWIINAKDMQSVVARVQIPHRVPYGFHGSWFSESDLRSQRALDSTSRGKD